MRPLRLGAVSYLNARPLVYGLDREPALRVRFDVPARCADLLHAGAIDLGLVPSIEYLRVPAERSGYAIVPGLAIASDGPVASVALYTTRPVKEVRSIALDTSSRTSVALVRVLCAKVFEISPRMESSGPDLAAMLTSADAALIIGDNALIQPQGTIQLVTGASVGVEKIDLGATWTSATGLPFVYAFWAGPVGPVGAAHVAALQRALAEGQARSDRLARDYFRNTLEHQELGARYLRDNIKYRLGPREREGLELFYRYAAEAGVVPATRPLTFFEGASRE
jgi:chorismate dehydratase